MIRVALFEPEKPANTGNIIRTCMAFDCALTIIGPTTFEISDKAFLRAKMDYGVGFPIERIATIDSFLAKYKAENGYFITRYADKTYTKMEADDPAKDVFFLFGRESTGIPKNVLKRYPGRDLRIPMAINARSLNLSNSVAIIVSEALRQQSFHGLALREEIKGEDFLSCYPEGKE